MIGLYRGPLITIFYKTKNFFNKVENTGDQ